MAAGTRKPFLPGILASCEFTVLHSHSQIDPNPIQPNPIILVRCKYFYIQTSQVSLWGISSPCPAGLGPALWIRTWISLSALCSLRLVICLTSTSREPDIYCMKLDARKAKIVNPYPRSGFDIFLYKNIIHYISICFLEIESFIENCQQSTIRCHSSTQKDTKIQ